MISSIRSSFNRGNKCISVSRCYGWRRLDLYLDIFGFIFAFSVCVIGLLLYFPSENVEYALRGAEISGILFAGTAIGLIIINIKRSNDKSNFIGEEKNLFYLNMLFKSLKKWSDEKKLVYTPIEDDKLSRVIWYKKNSSLPLVYIHLEIIDKYLDFKIRFRSKETIHSIFPYLNKSMIRLGIDGQNMVPIKRPKIKEKNMLKVHQTILECVLNPVYESRYFTSS